MMVKRSKIFRLFSGSHTNNCKDSKTEPDFVTNQPSPSRILVDSQKPNIQKTHCSSNASERANNNESPNIEKNQINMSDPEFCAAVTPKLAVTPKPGASQSHAELTIFQEPVAMQAPIVVKRSEVGPKLSTMQEPKVMIELAVRPESLDAQERGVIKGRAVIRESSVLQNVEASDSRIPIVFIVHARSNYKLALEIAEKLKHAGCIVALSGNILKDRRTNYHEALMEIQQQVDFVVFVLTNALLEQIFPNQGNPFTSDHLEEKEANRLVYELCFREYSRVLLKFHKARPVCISRKTAAKVVDNPILNGCFQLWKEFDTLVKNMFVTKNNNPLDRLPSQFITVAEKKEKLPLSLMQANNRYKKNGTKKGSHVAEDKIVLFIANQDYVTLDRLSAPIKDVTELAEMFQSMNFKVIVAKNLTAKEMRNVVDGFCSLLVPNSYGVFFFAGHGLEKFGQTYLLPVEYNAGFSPEDCICKEEILKCMQERRTSLNAFFLDCCRALPQGPWEIKEPFVAQMGSNTVYVFATTFSNLAYEKRKNSLLTKGLKKHMCKNYSIQKLGFKIQKDSSGEPRLNPDFHSTLNKGLKLCDPVRSRTSGVHAFPWKMVQEETFVDFGDLNCTVVLRIADTLDGTAIQAFLETKENFHSEDFLNLEMVVVGLRLLPLEGFHLKKIPLQPKNRYFLFTKKILDIEIIKNQFLRGCIYFSSGVERKEGSEFCIWLRKLQVKDHEQIS